MECAARIQYKVASTVHKHTHKHTHSTQTALNYTQAMHNARYD